VSAGILLVAGYGLCGHKRLIDTEAVLDLIEADSNDLTMKDLATMLRCETC